MPQQAGRRGSARGVPWLIALAAISGCSSRRLSVPLLPPLIAPPKAAVLWREPFERLDPSQWREVEVHGHTDYAQAIVEGRACLRIQSHGGASVLLHPIRFDPDDYEWLSWSWRVDRPIEGEALDRKEGSDAAARLYVYFDSGGLPWQKRNLDYVWSSTLPVGTTLNSAFSSTSKIIVVDNRAASLGQWRSIERNLEDDYKRCFGEDPPDVVAIGVMTDTDNTGGEALAYLDELRVSRQSGQAASVPDR